MVDEENKTIWDIPGVGQLISGIKTELMKVSSNDVVIHVQFPAGTPHDRSAAFAQAMRKEFPPRVRMCFTTPGVKISVSRPKEVNLTLQNCEMSMADVHDYVDKALAEEADTVNIVISNIKWKRL